MTELFYNLIYEPLYNALILLINLSPQHSVAVAVILLTVFVKFALLPMSYKMVKTQKQMKEIMPEIEKIKEKYKDDKQKQTLEILALYKEKNIKPFGSFFLLLIQLPVIIGLYWVFLKAGLPNLSEELLYSFVPAPEFVNMHLFGISMSDKSALLAALAGFSQFAFSYMTAKDIKIAQDDEEGFKADLQKSLQIQMKYILPVIIAVVAYTLSAGIALYFIVSNIFSVFQEIFFRFKKLK